MIILNVKHNMVECKANVRQDNNECGAVSGACEGSTCTCLRDTPVSSQYVFWAQRIEIRNLESKANIQVQCTWYMYLYMYLVHTMYMQGKQNLE